MDFDIAALQINSYLKQINEVTTQSEEKHCRISEGERNKLALEQEVERLERKKSELQDLKTKHYSNLSNLTTKIIDLKEESKSITQLENEYHELRKTEDAKVWELSQRVYSENTVYCDKVQEFVENYRFTEMITKLVYPSCTELIQAQNKIGKAHKEIELLRSTKDKLMNEIIYLNSRHACVTEVLERKASTKQERLEGKEFLNLQVSINKCKEESKKLLQDISEMELKRQEKKNYEEPGFSSYNYIKKPKAINVANVNSSRLGSCFSFSGVKHNLESENNNKFTYRSPVEEIKKEKKHVHFVPKTMKRFKPSSKK